MNTTPIKIGFWKSEYEPHYPHPNTFIDDKWQGEEKDNIIKYLKEQPIVNRYKGSSTCRICNKLNGTVDISDGKFLWPSGFAHYLEDHNVKPPQEFIDHVLSTNR